MHPVAIADQAIIVAAGDVRKRLDVVLILRRQQRLSESGNFGDGCGGIRAVENMVDQRGGYGRRVPVDERLAFWDVGVHRSERIVGGCNHCDVGGRGEG